MAQTWFRRKTHRATNRQVGNGYSEGFVYTLCGRIAHIEENDGEMLSVNDRQMVTMAQNFADAGVDIPYSGVNCLQCLNTMFKSGELTPVS